MRTDVALLIVDAYRHDSPAKAATPLPACITRLDTGKNSESVIGVMVMSLVVLTYNGLLHALPPPIRKAIFVPANLIFASLLLVIVNSTAALSLTDVGLS